MLGVLKTLQMSVYTKSLDAVIWADRDPCTDCSEACWHNGL